ncbi:AMP-binding protein [Bacillus sp. OK048]|uniref:AMP-binding protein n=1 Tax=Bacillus sp. OK048 TaxID=1882761 RepID=UPI000883FD65|nr:AMP-binding protein [Bacillus sp. OK048]SDN31419.1 crotonobetaine/carnitine-CoA ligase [Bacillus sp. OK048]
MSNLGYHLEGVVQESPDLRWLYYQDQIFTLGELSIKINKAANVFSSLGVKRGDKVALVLSNNPEYLFCWFGLAKIGAVMVPINTSTKGEMLSYIISHSDAVMALVEEPFLNEYMQIKSTLKKIQHSIVISDSSSSIDQNDFYSFKKLLDDASPLYIETNKVLVEDLMCILYTSGTTGVPKGVMLSQNAYVAAGAASANQIFQFRPDDVIYTCLPFFHVNAQMGTTMPALLSKVPLAVGKKFSASKFWSEMDRYKVTVFKFIGAMITILYKNSSSEIQYHNTVRLGIGAPVPKDLWLPFEQRFGLQLLEGYGTTETTTACIANRPNDFRIGSCGKPISHYEISIRDEENLPVSPKKPGELCIRPLKPHVFMEGYYKMEDKTNEALIDGWFHTGDRAYQDEDGFYFFLDRTKDVIRRKGENISSFMVEKIINNHPKVFESAAIGIPNELSEDEVKVFVKLKPGEAATEKDIYDWCEKYMSEFMYPRFIEFIYEFPKTPTEKVQKFKLKELSNENAWDSSELLKKEKMK